MGSKWFQRFAREEGIRDAVLLEAIARAETKIDADLGGGVIKQRLARPGEGKSKGYRIIIFFRLGGRFSCMDMRRMTGLSSIPKKRLSFGTQRNSFWRCPRNN